VPPINIQIRDLPYAPDGADYARRLADCPGFVFLDSRRQRSSMGHYDVITALPDRVHALADHHGDAEAWMCAIEADLETVAGIPRSRIAVGFLDYDSAAAHLGVPSTTFQPGLAGVYNWHILQDHRQSQAWLIADPAARAEILDEVTRRLADPAPPHSSFHLDSPFVCQTSRADYRNAIQAIHRYIEAGDCYQVNYAQRFHTTFRGDTFGAYLTLRDVAPGDFSAYLRFKPDHSILSLSPERFLSVAPTGSTAGFGLTVTAQPIKGTRPRGRSPEEDRAIAESLLASAKDQAENVMITDLLRNDLGRYCEPGSVTTPELCALHSFDNVHHLVSLVEGRLKSGTTPGTLLLGCSPGGSITGAPKRRAVEIIRELEAFPRGVYCGSVFALGNDGWLQSSIAIRTFEALDTAMVCWGGGGIVHESDPDAEYQETLDKVGGFMAALERQ